MTRTHAEVGDQLDAEPGHVVNFEVRTELRKVALERLERAEREGDTELARELKWELGIFDFSRPRHGVTEYVGPADPKYAEFYGLHDAADAYARERASETKNPALRARYADFVLLRMEPKGRPWVERSRFAAQAYRDYVDHALGHMTGEEREFAGLYIARAIQQIARIIGPKGILSSEEHTEWARWLLGVARTLRDFDWPEARVEMQHRWPYEVLEHLVVLTPAAIPEDVRAEAFELLEQAYGHYSADPLGDTFTSRVAEVEATLRKSFGDPDAHRTMIRKQFKALVSRAKFHEDQGGDRLIVQHFLHAARGLAEQHRQYFTEAGVRQLERDGREAIETAVEAGEFKQVSLGSVTIDASKLNLKGARPEDAVESLMKSAGLDPDLAALRADAEQARKDFPLQFLFPATHMGHGKVLGQAFTPEQHLEAQVEQRICLSAQMNGMKIALILARAAADCGLTAAHLLAPLKELEIGDSTAAILETGFSRFLDGDYVSAAHILTPRFEGVLREYLRRLGVDLAEFRRFGETGLTRTDDVTLGVLLQRGIPEGPSVKDLLGESYWHYVKATMASPTGMNLRNKFAHGLAELVDCDRANVAIIVHLLLRLVGVARLVGGKSGDVQ